MLGKIVPFRERLRQKRRIILFICTGNTCRSPMAASYFRKLLDERNMREVEVRSAGVMTITGLLASQEAIQVMDGEGVDLRRHRSTQLTPELIRKADLILAMSPFHRQTALRMAEDAKDKTFLFKEFCKSDLKNVQIADPMGCTLEVFKKCFKEVKAACDRLIEHEFVTGRSVAQRSAARRTPVAGKKAKNSKKAAAPKSTKAATGTAKLAATVKEAPAAKIISAPVKSVTPAKSPASAKAVNATAAQKSTAPKSAASKPTAPKPTAAPKPPVAQKSVVQKPVVVAKAVAPKPAITAKPAIVKHTTAKPETAPNVPSTRIASTKTIDDPGETPANDGKAAVVAHKRTAAPKQSAQLVAAKKISGKSIIGK